MGCYILPITFTLTVGPARQWATQMAEAGKELREAFTNVNQMGHNGEWKFTFTTPFYMWLLENLY